MTVRCYVTTTTPVCFPGNMNGYLCNYRKVFAKVPNPG